MSISFWYKSTSNSEEFILFKKQFENSEEVDYEFSIINNNLVIYTGTRNGTYKISVATPTVNQWHHIVVVLSINSSQQVTYSLYYDGVQMRTYTLAKKFSSLYSNLIIGMSKGSNTVDMSDFRVYGVPLTLEQINEIYSSKSIPTVTLSTESSVVSSSFTLTIDTSKPLSGLDSSALKVNPWNAATFGTLVPVSDTQFVVSVTPHVYGTFSVFMPAHMGYDNEGTFNQNSNVMTITYNRNLHTPLFYTK